MRWSGAMRRPADRRGQSTVEWLAVIGGVALAFAAGALVADGLPARLATRLAPPATRLDRATLAAAIAGRRDVPTLAGAEAWLAEDVGATAARREVARAIVAAVRSHHGAWLRPFAITGAAVRGRRTRAVVEPRGAIEVRLVDAEDERRADGAALTGADRVGAGAITLGWSGAGALARRVARPLGLAVGAAQLALGLVDGAEARQPPGTRAGDVLVCRRVAIRIEAAALPGRSRVVRGWRVGVLRDGRLVLDAVADHDPCRSPAGGEAGRGRAG